MIMNTIATTTLVLAGFFLGADEVAGFSPPVLSQFGVRPSRFGGAGNNKDSSSRGRVLASAVSSNQDLLPGIQAIENGNEKLFKRLETLREAAFFRLYSVDILASCEYMPQELFECYTEGCEILPLDEDEVPNSIRNVDLDEAVFPLDGWGRWDMPTEDYYDIQEYPEGYTGYDGSDVWNFIHERIEFEDASDGHWKADFNKAVSGLHSMISAQIIQGIQTKIDDGDKFEDKEVWRDPKVEFNRRLGSNPDVPLALENLYFFFMVVLSAVSKVRTRLLQDCQAGRIAGASLDELQSILQSDLLNDPTITAVASKLQSSTAKDSGNLWVVRQRTRELARIMNCVQCNKCRLHGKISSMGLSTAFQLLIGPSGTGEDPQNIHRVGLATLLTTLHKTSRAIEYCRSMQ